MELLDVKGINEFLCIDGSDYISFNTDNCIPLNTIPTWNTGTKGLTTNSHLQKDIARQNAIKRNSNYKGENNPRAKTWKITFEDGKVIVIKALLKWCNDNGYNRCGIKKIIKGEWKKYRDIVTVEELSTTSPMSA